MSVVLRRTWPWLAVILVAGLVARLGALGNAVMFDDAASWVFASLPWSNFLQVLWQFEGNMALYFLTLRGWLVFGDSEVTLRGLSVLFGVATVALTYAIGHRLWTRRAGLIAAALLAVHPLHVGLSQEARGYALEVMLLALATYLLIVARSSNARAAWAGYVLSAALACYSHVLAVLVLAVHWIWLVGMDGWRTLLRRWPAALALAVLVAPILLYVVTHDRGQVDWVPDFNRYRFRNNVLPLAGGSNALFLLSALLCAAACVQAWRAHREQLAGVALTVLWLCVPIALLAIKSATGKSLFLDRYLLFCVPALLLLVGVGIDDLLRSRRLLVSAGSIAGLGLLALLLQASVTRYHQLLQSGNPPRVLTQHVLANQRPGDELLFFPSQMVFSFEYYARRAGGSLVPVKFPDFGGVPTGQQRNPSADEIEAAIQSAQRVWLVLNAPSVRMVRGAKDTLPVIRATLEREHVLVETRVEDWVSLELYERRAATQGVAATP